MTAITFKCDRCGKEVSGLYTREGTAGFYNVGNPTWAKYGRHDENFVCDECVQSTDEYKADYGGAA